LKDLDQICGNVRKEILDLCYRSGSGHIGSSFSIVEILVVLYFHAMRGIGADKKPGSKDRLVLSKGHGCPALYSVLHQRGILSTGILDGFAKDGGTLEQHPSRNPALGIDVSTGSLGHGLSIAAGMALGNRLDGPGDRVFAVLSDGELNEGSTWEAIMFAAQHRLDNLVCIVDSNKMQALGRTQEIINLEPLSSRWSCFGWSVAEIDGHSTDELTGTLARIPFNPGKPTCIIANTIKGKGICFMENDLLWHYRCPDREEFDKANRELCSL